MGRSKRDRRRRQQKRREQEAQQSQAVSATPPGQTTQAVYRQASVKAEFEGPIPPPAILEQYNDVLPGAAERVVAMAERQSEHRMALESSVISWDVRRANLGLAAGFIVAMSFLAASIYLIVEGYAWSGTILGTVDLVALVGTFVYGSIARRRELVGH